MSEKKTLLLVSFLEPWSMGHDAGAPSLYETIRGFAENGWQIHYLTAEKYALSGGSHEKEIFLDIAAVSVHRFHFPARLTMLGNRVHSKLNRLYFFPKYAAASLRQLVTDIDPMLIYAYEEGAVLALARLKNSGFSTCPVLHRFQGTILGNDYKNIAKVTRKIESWLALRAKADLYVMTDDGTLGDRALSYWNTNVESQNLLFIRNGIDLSIRFNQVDKKSTLKMFSADKNSPVLLMVSRLAGWKRIDRGIDLVAKLIKQYSSAKLIVVGDGEYREKLALYAQKKGVAKSVFFAGSRPRSEVFALMKSCDIFLSLYDISNCGNPLFEALMSGIPVITLNNGTTSAVITDRVNGLLIEPDDQNSLFSATRELFEDELLCRKISDGGLAWADKHMLSWNERMEIELNWIDTRIQAIR